MESIDQVDIFIGCAAVADYRPKTTVDQKIKKTEQELTLTFVKNPDILATVSERKDRPFCVGFAAESQDVETYARAKLVKKQLNMIAANDITAEGLGFNSDKNALHVIWPEGDKKLPATSKDNLAMQLLSLIAEQYSAVQKN
jgi:phosphopantothenoylcysteine decarboxylase/phosphopantothenate--cysteine ligase